VAYTPPKKSYSWACRHRSRRHEFGRPWQQRYFLSLPDITINALRDDVVALVARRRLPAIYSESFFVKLGGLAFYGPNRMEGFRRAAGYVDRILRGEKPGGTRCQLDARRRRSRSGAS
jgi:hypothetical protein